MALTNKQAAFVAEYAKDLNATAAAGRAGYSDPNYGRQLITNPNVAQAIKELQQEARTDAVLTARELQEWWSSLIQGHDPDARVSDRLKASELLGKSQAIFTDKTEQSGRQTIEVVYVEQDAP